MPIIATKTIIGLVAAGATAIAGGIAGDIDETYGLASNYAETKVINAIEDIAKEEFHNISMKKYSSKGIGF